MGFVPLSSFLSSKKGSGVLTAKEQSLLDALEPTARKKLIEIVSVEIVGARKAPTIRVYIDTPDGVSFDQLSEAQAWIGTCMDRLDPFPGAYTLEVSSPGIDRPLRTPEHFERYAGETVRVCCRQPVDKRATWTGVLKGFRDGCVILDVDSEEVSIDYKNIKRANVKGAIDFTA